MRKNDQAAVRAPGPDWQAPVRSRTASRVKEIAINQPYLEASGMMLPLWEDVLRPADDEEVRRAADKIAAALDSDD